MVEVILSLFSIKYNKQQYEVMFLLSLINRFGEH